MASDFRMIVNEEFRAMILRRYHHDYLVSRFAIKTPPSVSDAILNWFADQVYPTHEKLLRLEAAFAALERFTVDPARIWYLLGNLTKAVFTYGRLFPQALKTGLKALQSFRKAKAFEKELSDATLRITGGNRPGEDDLHEGMRNVDRRLAVEFLNTLPDLLQNFRNPVLVDKTILILQGFAGKMKSHPDTYGPEDIDGISLGLELLEGGRSVFTRLTDDEKSEIINVILENEKDFIRTVYGTAFLEEYGS